MRAICLEFDPYLADLLLARLRFFSKERLFFPRERFFLTIAGFTFMSRGRLVVRSRC